MGHQQKLGCSADWLGKGACLLRELLREDAVLFLILNSEGKDSQCCWSEKKGTAHNTNCYNKSTPDGKELPRNGQRSKFRGRRHNADAKTPVATGWVTLLQVPAPYRLRLLEEDF